ncbi:GyrI-like domain-containing protein [Algoriphagus aestuarii]|nr:GyrI-like domain-containing protein [Algoriphagus aestuarii]
MKVEIVEIEPIRLVGKKIRTSIGKNENSLLWRPFRQQLKNFPEITFEKFYSISFYGNEVKYGTFTPETIFEKWAAIDYQEPVPEGFEILDLEGGVYAVFEFAGSPIHFQTVMQEFYGKWLPTSGFGLDTRPHFETFDETYDPFSDRSVEHIWIPVIPKK